MNFMIDEFEEEDMSTHPESFTLSEKEF